MQDWWLVAIVDGETGKVIREAVDGVQASRASEAIRLAGKRNPLRPGQVFGVSKATKGRLTYCLEANGRRTREIAEFTELMECK